MFQAGVLTFFSSLSFPSGFTWEISRGGAGPMGKEHFVWIVCSYFSSLIFCFSFGCKSLSTQSWLETRQMGCGVGSSRVDFLLWRFPLSCFGQIRYRSCGDEGGAASLFIPFVVPWAATSVPCQPLSCCYCRGCRYSVCSFRGDRRGSSLNGLSHGSAVGMFTQLGT